MPDKRKALVIDDEKLVCESCSSILGGKDFFVKTTMSARDGLRYLDKKDFDILLVDLRMHDIDGIEVIEKVKAKFPDMPIVVLTGYPSVDTAVKTTQLGAMEYLAKPFTPEELMNGVNSALEKWEQANSLRQAKENKELTAQVVEAAIQSVGAERHKRESAGLRRGVITVDRNACTGCLTCMVECGAAHMPLSDKKRFDLSTVAKALGQARVQVESVGTQYDTFRAMPMRCNQCEDPPCAKVCPSKAITKLGPNMPVVVDDKLCIGCKSCVLACPFGCMFVNTETSMPIKCDLCMGIVEPGEDPVCVRSCPASALKFTPLEDAAQETRNRAAHDFYEASLEVADYGKET